MAVAMTAITTGGASYPDTKDVAVVDGDMSVCSLWLLKALGFTNTTLYDNLRCVCVDQRARRAVYNVQHRQQAVPHESLDISSNPACILTHVIMPATTAYPAVDYCNKARIAPILVADLRKVFTTTCPSLSPTRETSAPYRSKQQVGPLEPCDLHR